MKELILDILDKYLKVFPNEENKQAKFLEFINSSSAEELIDWNNFDGHIVADGFIYAKKEKKFLVLHHNEFNAYLSPGGHMIESDNNPLETAIREIKEETALDNLKHISICKDELIPLDIDTYKVTYNMELDIPEHYHFDFRYLFMIDEIQDITLEIEEVSDYRWIDINELSLTYKEEVLKIKNLLSQYNNLFSIIEIGSNNTKTHIYDNNDLIYENNVTIEFKKNYYLENKVNQDDLNKLYDVIQESLKYTNNIYVFGCSIFRNMKDEELKEINDNLVRDFNVKIEVVSQEDEAYYTALGCFNEIDYKGNICVFIGGGGSIELILVSNKKIIDKIYYDFGVVDITTKFDTLKNDIPDCTFDEVYSYVDSLVGDINFDADCLILAGGDHFYWYNNARYELIENNLYHHDKQPYMLTIEMSDKYDRDALVTSLDSIRANSDNPKWFDGSRAMKVITNLISHKISAEVIIPTKINMEDGLKNKINQEN